jgi:hypothetical protein
MPVCYHRDVLAASPPGSHAPSESRAIPSRVARILWLLPDPTSAHTPGGMDPPQATSLPLAAMAKRPQPLHRTATAWPAKVPRGGCCRLADRFLAHVRTSGRPTGPAQPVLRRPRSSPPLCSCPGLTRSNRRGTDPYARWCGRGGAARRPPIPIDVPKPAIPLSIESARLDGNALPMTSSARASRIGGTERPSALAVFRLIARSNAVGCCTGRSAGLAPLRIFPQ